MIDLPINLYAVSLGDDRANVFFTMYEAVAYARKYGGMVQTYVRAGGYIKPKEPEK